MEKFCIDVKALSTRDSFSLLLLSLIANLIIYMYRVTQDERQCGFVNGQKSF